MTDQYISRYIAEHRPATHHIGDRPGMVHVTVWTGKVEPSPDVHARRLTPAAPGLLARILMGAR